MRRMENKKIILSFLSMVFSILLLAASVFAWFTLQSQTRIDEIVLNVNNLKSEIKLEVSKNDGKFIELIEKQDFDALFGNSVPSDKFHFRLTITNKSSKETNLKVVLSSIYSDNVNEGFDMRNVFYIKDGVVTINGIDKVLEINEEELDQLFDQELNLYNFNNLISNNNITILENYNFEIEESVIIEFKIIYDHKTSRIEYQDGKLSIGSINIHNN